MAGRQLLSAYVAFPVAEALHFLPDAAAEVEQHHRQPNSHHAVGPAHPPPRRGRRRVVRRLRCGIGGASRFPLLLLRLLRLHSVIDSALICTC